MNLSTSYLGLELAHPFIAGASPMSAQLDTIKRLEDAGCAAVVLHSLFEEQVTMAQSGRIRHRDPLEEEFAASLAVFPTPGEYPCLPESRSGRRSVHSARCKEFARRRFVTAFGTR